MEDMASKKKTAKKAAKKAAIEKGADGVSEGSDVGSAPVQPTTDPASKGYDPSLPRFEGEAREVIARRMRRQ